MTLLKRGGRLVRSRRGAVGVAVFWLLAVAIGPRLAPTLDSVADNRSGNNPPATAESMRAQDLLRDRFPDQRGTPALVVVSRPGGHLNERDLGQVDGLARSLSGPDRPNGTGDAAPTVLSDDRSTAVVAVPVLVDSGDSGAFNVAVDQMRAAAHAVPWDRGVQVAVSGPAGIVRDTLAVFGEADLALMFGTLALVLVILLLVYRSVLLSLIPLAAAGIAIQLTNAVAALLAKAGLITVTAQTAAIMTVLVIGLGTDYCLFIISGYRSRLARHEAPPLQVRLAEMAGALRDVGESLLYSATTVVLGLLVLLAATIPGLRAFGPFLALSVVLTLAVCATFVPAVVALLGRVALWPSRVNAARPARLWGRLGALVVRRPRAVMAGCLVLLALLSAGLVGYRDSYDFVAGFRVNTESKTGEQLLAGAFPVGRLAPTTVVVDTGTSSVDAHSTQLREAQRRIVDIPGVATVESGPRDVSPDRHTARFTVVSKDNPYGNAALDRTVQVRQVASQELTGTHVLVGGPSAVATDLRAANDRDLRVIIPLLMLVIALVLGVMTRSLLAPLYLLATIVASLAAAVGLTVLLLMTLGGGAGFSPLVLAYIVVFLTALGVDYNIYLTSQLRKRIASGGPVHGITTTMTSTGRVISSAGIILAATFAVLTSQPFDGLFQFGFAMAAGILLDTFLVRGLLVPAIVRFAGRHAWWPSPGPVLPAGPVRDRRFGGRAA
ncbi:MMPL family transporter [Amycolatopsis alkalitolerans]|uniref:MMPL family transporter n=1 Tax=Amycolatopsis alkalitolerans TaxID=2547244 RepID=A0A5C4LVJ2_9PSEU|nr:MMPL family transporter [Amycolatopsis alkalitolerans]TNC20082.1 MMPL family transporter [Amycolatopsis alkalitolerans]